MLRAELDDCMTVGSGMLLVLEYCTESYAQSVMIQYITVHLITDM